MKATDTIFGEVISTYTRAQAVDDGVLVDVTSAADEAGFKWLTAMTRTVYERYVAVPPALVGCQDVQGRLMDIIHMLWVAVRTGRIEGDVGEFGLLVRFPAGATWQSNEKRHAEGEGLRLVTLKAVSGPGDDHKPFITILMPDED